MMLPILLMTLVGCDVPNAESAAQDMVGGGRLTLTPATCPKDVKRAIQTSDISGLAGRMVPGAPIALVVCRGDSRVEITDTTRVTTFTAALNALPRVPPGVFSCPASPDPDFGLFFNFENGEVVGVDVDTDCSAATNGHKAGWLDESLTSEVSAIAPADSP